MPKRPLTVCSHPGCHQLVKAGRCARHRRIAKNLRASSAERGYGPEWRRYRRDFLRRNPFCTTCQAHGRREKATVVDHIVPPAGPADPLFWDPSNHQALCATDHNRKTASQDGGFGNPKRTPQPARTRRVS